MKIAVVVFAFLALAHAVSHSPLKWLDDWLFEGDGSQFMQPLMVKICKNITDMQREHVVGEIGAILEAFRPAGKDASSIIPIFASQVHVLMDLFEASNSTLGQFAAKCDNLASSLENFKDGISEADYAPFKAKITPHLLELCSQTPKLNHKDVRKMAADFADANMGKALIAKREQLLIGLQLAMHILLARYDIQSSKKDFKDEHFTKHCKDEKTMMDMLFPPM